MLQYFSSMVMIPTQSYDPVALASGDAVLTIDTQPSDNEANYEVGFFFRRDYRTGIPSGTTVDNTLLMCDARRGGTSTTPDPTVQWIRNGELINNSTGLMTSVTIDSFSQSDVGEYQCIYTDSDNDAEVLTSIPYRLQTGELWLRSYIYTLFTFLL